MDILQIIFGKVRRAVDKMVKDFCSFVSAPWRHIVIKIQWGWLQNVITRNVIKSSSFFSPRRKKCRKIGKKLSAKWQKFCWPIEILEQRTQEGGTSGLVVMGGGHMSKGWEFESQNHILVGHFFTYVFLGKFVSDPVAGKGRLWVMSFICKYKTSTTYPLYETTWRFVLINKWHEYNPPYPKSAFTHNPGTA